MKVSDKYHPNEIIELKQKQGERKLTYERVAVVLAGDPAAQVKSDEAAYITYKCIDGSFRAPEGNVEKILADKDLVLLGEKVKADQQIMHDYQLLHEQAKKLLGSGTAGEIRENYYGTRRAEYESRFEKGKKLLDLLNENSEEAGQNNQDKTKDENWEISLEEDLNE